MNNALHISDAAHFMGDGEARVYVPARRYSVLRNGGNFLDMGIVERQPAERFPIPGKVYEIAALKQV